MISFEDKTYPQSDRHTAFEYIFGPLIQTHKHKHILSANSTKYKYTHIFSDDYNFITNCGAKLIRHILRIIQSKTIHKTLSGNRITPPTPRPSLSATNLKLFKISRSHTFIKLDTTLTNRQTPHNNSQQHN